MDSFGTSHNSDKPARIETDSLGDVEVPQDALYGAQTQRAVDNFTLAGGALPASLIYAIIRVKHAAAKANLECGVLDFARAGAIQTACNSLLEGKHLQHFPVDIYQTGSGTSSNMNVNEVISQLCAQANLMVHPNDHVNCSQSSNDVFPSSIRIACAELITHKLLPALEHLHQVITSRATELAEVVKTGRTHLMDAMPVTFGQVLSGWASQIDANRQRLTLALNEISQLPQGGTAVGTGINTPADFAATFARCLSEDTGIGFTPVEQPFTKIGAQDDLAALSGNLKTLAVTLLKISNDLRWMNSGPLAGIGEISLPALQPGSSIMPGKVNPVIPEATAMAATQVMGLDVATTSACGAGNFELNVMLPLIGSNLIQSINLMSGSAVSLADKAIAGFSVNYDNIQRPLAKNPILVTALNAIIGYSKAAEIAKKAYAEQRDVIDVAAEETDLSREELTQLLDPKRLTHP
ncbi:class II fumarate hydratase [Gilvimarinus polysaccharolyticus]|uniref:class II fumarate hydratase n=1 Tax=Gilvimarinus polysaccharolyticus TaxID=863921 RepID=UPI000673BC29|nr:class II fumarate hydratase [Gilvimarinus polysaccharolyticus]